MCLQPANVRPLQMHICIAPLLQTAEEHLEKFHACHRLDSIGSSTDQDYSSRRAAQRDAPGPVPVPVAPAAPHGPEHDENEVYEPPKILNQAGQSPGGRVRGPRRCCRRRRGRRRGRGVTVGSLANLTADAERRQGDHGFRDSGTNGDPMLRNGIASVRS